MIVSLSFFLLLVPQLTLAINDITDLAPISHWTCDETSGVRYDSNTTNSNDLTDNNTVAYATGLLGNACDFETTNSEYFSITDGGQTGLENFSAYSISLWFKLESATPFDVNWGFVNKYSGGSGGYFLEYRQYPSNNDNFLSYARDGSGNNSSHITNDLGIANDVWHHIVTTYNNSTKVVKMYLDGTLLSNTYVNSLATAVPNTTDTFLIGKSTTGVSFDGLFDEITIDNEEWASTTVSEIYNSGTPLPYLYTPTPTSSSATTSTSTIGYDIDTHFMLAVIIFFLALMSFGWVFSSVRKH